MNSLNRRLLTVSLCILAGFLGVAGLALERAFQGSLLQAKEDRLQAHLYSLLAAAEQQGEVLVVGQRHPDERLLTPGSGLYAAILDSAGQVVWRSDSLLGQDLALSKTRDPGQDAFFQPSSGGDYLAYAYGVQWQSPGQPERDFTLVIAEALRSDRDQFQGFRTRLWLTLGAAGVVLLLALAGVVRWGLAPLRQVTRDIDRIESGQASELTGRYPVELQGLTRNLNTLIHNERQRMARYRDTLGNLAHSLKTPLAVLQNGLSADRDPELLDQIRHMNQLVEYQLQKAVASGQATFAAPLKIRPVLERLSASLNKVYRDQSVDIELWCDGDLSVRMDEGDVLELFGNLLDNGCKWARNRVQIWLERSGGCQLEVCIRDDGPGIPDTEIERVKQRGERHDPQVAGHGIGLAVAVSIAQSYGGTLILANGDAGGAEVRLSLPVL